MLIYLITFRLSYKTYPTTLWYFKVVGVDTLIYLKNKKKA